jgi:hypothetical protein
VAKFGSNWFSGFREEDFFFGSLQMDDVGRRVVVVARLAFWSGVLEVDPGGCPESGITLTGRR